MWNTDMFTLDGMRNMRKTKPRSNVHIWMHYNPEITPEEWEARFHRLDHMKIRRAFVFGDFGRDIIDIAHKFKIGIHACQSVVQNHDTSLPKDHPEWFMVSRNGVSSAGGINWLCMNNPLAVNYVYTQVESLCQIPGLDGIQLDTIRYPQIEISPVDSSVSDASDYCYCQYCRDKFKNRTGIDPVDIPEPSSNEAWIQFRVDTINTVVREIARIARIYDKTISATVLPTPVIARQMAYQGWDQWDLDAIYPAMFNDFFLEGTQWLTRCIHESIQSINMPLYAGLHLPSFSAEMLDIALDASWEATGSALYAYENLRREHEDVLRRRRYFF